MTGPNAMYHLVLTVSYNVATGTTQGTYQERKLIPDGTSRATVLTEALKAAAEYFRMPPTAMCSVVFFDLQPDDIRSPERRSGVVAAS